MHTKKYHRFQDYLVEKLHDHQEANAFLAVAIEEYEKDRYKEAFMLALSYLTEAKGGISKLSKRGSLRQGTDFLAALYRVLFIRRTEEESILK
jgi:DNA-binding phage protein